MIWTKKFKKPVTEMTAEEKIAQLDAQYQADKSTLMQYYLELSISGDTEGAESVKSELEALATQYDADLAEIEGGNA